MIFCLPYNNDLAEHSAFIQAELGRLHTDDRVAITLLVDTPEEPVTFLHYPGGTAPGTDTTRWHSCQSVEALAAFLEWGRTRVPRAKRRAFFQLGHGGVLNRMLLDQHPDSAWMSTVQFAQILGAHTTKYDGFDALTLQQCSKATLTELVELAPMAEAGSIAVAHWGTQLLLRPTGGRHATPPLQAAQSLVARLHVSRPGQH